MRDVLQPHANAFVDWRYLHEPQQNIMSDKSLFVATLEMVLREFKKCYRTEKASLTQHIEALVEHRDREVSLG